MKIGIDISPIIYETGVSVYTDNLVRNLSIVDNKNEYKLFAGSFRRRSDFGKYLSEIKNQNFKAVVYPLPPTFLNFLWNKIHIYDIENFIGDVDIFHSSDWTQPPTRSVAVTTIHDLVPILYPEWSLPRIVDAHKRRLTWVQKEVDIIIVPTSATKDDLKRLGFKKNKIVVIPEAPEDIYKPVKSGEINKIKDKYEINEDYILSIGVTPRKNIKNILSAFKKLKKRNSKIKLVIVGHKYQDIDDDNDVIFTGHVIKAYMPALYAGAECLLYPSLYEGFGLPILEAMACEVPVVTSDRSSMKEVAGDSAVLVNPENVDEIIRGVEKSISKRNELTKKGKKRANEFSWRKTSQQTLKVYEKYQDKK